MSTKTEDTLVILAALLVLFSAMLDPRVSVIISIIAFVGFGFYRLVPKGK